jgi:hypothetical protein
MNRLWRAEQEHGSSVLRQRTLEDLGGPRAIVKTHVDSVVGRLEWEERVACARIFKFLVTPGGGKIAQSLDGLTELSGLSRESLARVLDQLASSSSRILAPVPAPLNQPQQAYYEIFHDSLAPAILDWRRRFEFGNVERIADEERQRADREGRLRHRVTAAFLALGLILVIVLVLSWEMHKRAIGAERMAEDARRSARQKAEAAVLERNEIAARSDRLLSRQEDDLGKAELALKSQAEAQRARRDQLVAENARLSQEIAKKEQQLQAGEKAHKDAMAANLPGQFTLACDSLLKREQRLTSELQRQLQACAKRPGEASGQNQR